MVCPAHLNVQEYVAIVKVRKYKEAVEIIMRDLPFPGGISGLGLLQPSFRP